MSNLSDRARGAMPAARRFVRDLTERALATFVQTFVAVWGLPLLGNAAAPDKTWQYVTDLSILQKAAVAAAGVALALVKGLVAKRFGNDDSASLAPGV